MNSCVGKQSHELSSPPSHTARLFIVATMMLLSPRVAGSMAVAIASHAHRVSEPHLAEHHTSLCGVHRAFNRIRQYVKALNEMRLSGPPHSSGVTLSLVCSVDALSPAYLRTNNTSPLRWRDLRLLHHVV